MTSEPSELAPRLEPEPPDGVSLDDLTLSVWENMAIGAALDLQLAVLPLGDGSMPLRALADGRTEQENLRSKYFQLVYVNEQRVQVVLGDTPLSYERVSRFYLKFTVTVSHTHIAHPPLVSHTPHPPLLLKPVAQGASRFGKLLARLTDKIITYWTKACDIPTISNLNTSQHTCCHRKPTSLFFSS